MISFSGPVYFVGGDDSYVHHGFTEDGSVTTTGQVGISISDNLSSYLADLTAHINYLPEPPPVGGLLNKMEAYGLNGSVFYAQNDVQRTEDDLMLNDDVISAAGSEYNFLSFNDDVVSINNRYLYLS